MKEKVNYCTGIQQMWKERKKKNNFGICRNTKTVVIAYNQMLFFLNENGNNFLLLCLLSTLAHISDCWPLKNLQQYIIRLHLLTCWVKIWDHLLQLLHTNSWYDQKHSKPKFFSRPFAETSNLRKGIIHFHLVRLQNFLKN